jgi:ornithine cyclodeaminase/alanine dehydrogenase-like protein (mu-crystallin family)
MTIRYVDEATVAQTLTPAILRDLMRRTLAAAARGEAHGPTRLVLATARGWFASMPALVALDDLHGLGTKLVSFFPQNVAVPTHHAVIAMLDPATGTFQALVAGETITERRTAAVSVVATERLAARPKGTLAILGAGVQGAAHLEAFLDAGLLTSLRVWSPTSANAERLASRARAAGVAAVVSGDASNAARGADVVVTATAAVEPLFAAAAIADGAHVNAVGACVPSRRELPAQLVAEANVYVDSIDAAWQESGDLLLAARDLGRDRVSIASELGAMLADPSMRHPPRRVTIFESLGLGIEDVACAAYVLSRLPTSS